MKKKIFLLATMAILHVQAFALSREQAREESDFLTDKMAYELNFLDSQWDDVYEINYDFFRHLGNVGHNYSELMQLRDRKLSYVLTGAQWELYQRSNHFLKPVRPGYNSWIFVIYDHYKRGKYFRDSRYIVDRYRGAHRRKPDYYHERYTARPRPITPVQPSHNQRKAPASSVSKKPQVAPSHNSKSNSNHRSASASKGDRRSK